MSDLDNPELENDSVEPEAPTPRRNARGAVLVGARIVTGAIGIAVAVATVGAAAWLPLPTLSRSSSSTTVTPVPTDQQRVCAGPVLRLGSDTGEGATTASSIGSPHTVSAASEGKIAESSLQSTDSATGLTPVKFTLPPAGSASSRAPLLAGSQTQTVDHGDLSGVTAAECREASGDTWLVGGATTTGRTTLVTISNPGEVIATVDLTVYTENGEITAAGTDGVVVPPGGQRILSLAGFAPGAASPVVRVQSRGSQVVAQLQQSVVRTLEPGGVEIVGPAADPAKLVVIPGLVLSDPETIAEHASSPGYDDLVSVLRFLVPGKKAAHAQITITAESGTAKPVVVNTTLDPGKVTETAFGEFPQGSYTVTVRADVPILAAARASVYTVDSSAPDGVASVDFAWFASAQTMSKSALVAVGNGPTPQLHLANLTGQAATVSVTQGALSPGSSHSAPQTVTIPAEGAVVLPAQKLSSYAVSGFQSLAISVSYDGAGALASYTVSPAGPASQPIKVYRR
ncbi:MAG: DUF5719 family protein [Lacisediminihabitans sp.]